MEGRERGLEEAWRERQKGWGRENTEGGVDMQGARGRTVLVANWG
jgi:hypothetical protein